MLLLWVLWWGSGGLLSIPFLMFMGLPPQVSIATNKAGSLGLSVGAFYKYSKEKKVQWKYMIPFTILAMISGLIGASILIRTDSQSLSRAVGVIIILLIPSLLMNNSGVRHKETSRMKKSIGYVLYFLAMVWGAFFGGGGGTLVFYITITFFGFTIIESAATNKIPWFVMSLFALVIYGINGLINYYYSALLILGMLVGGYLGARTAIKKGDRWVRWVFATVVLISGIKLIFF